MNPVCSTDAAFSTDPVGVTDALLPSPVRTIGPCPGCPRGGVRDPGFGLERVMLTAGAVVNLHRGACADDYTAGRSPGTFRFLDR